MEFSTYLLGVHLQKFEKTHSNIPADKILGVKNDNV